MKEEEYVKWVEKDMDNGKRLKKDTENEWEQKNEEKLISQG